MDNTSNVYYLIQIKKMLIEEIRIFETISGNAEYFHSLPIQDSEFKDTVNNYTASNNSVDSFEIVKKKRELLKNLNNTLKERCNHKIISGELNISKNNKNNVNYCIYCMNIFSD